jgi:hypothetical protein
VVTLLVTVGWYSRRTSHHPPHRTKPLSRDASTTLLKSTLIPPSLSVASTWFTPKLNSLNATLTKKREGPGPGASQVLCAFTYTNESPQPPSFHAPPHSTRTQRGVGYPTPKPSRPALCEHTRNAATPLVSIVYFTLLCIPREWASPANRTLLLRCLSRITGHGSRDTNHQSPVANHESPPLC